MLGKLIKYEFKATSRTFLPLYGAILIVALVQRFLGRNSQGLFEELNRIGDFTTIALVALFIALGVVTLVVTIQRFQKNLLSDEGYLMFTLPVKTRSLIASKMIVAVVWVILSGVVGITTFLILFMYKGFFTEFSLVLSDLMTHIKMILSNEAGRTGIAITIQFMIAGFLSYIQFVVVIYLSLAIGQFPKFQKHRSVASFIAFFVTTMLVNWVVGMVMFQISYITLEFSPNISLLIGNIIVLVVIGAMFEATNYILSKHINLE
ncbi:MAG: hypothetical protein ACRC1P_12205 [Cellulosilyticaceae bacterium]